MRNKIKFICIFVFCMTIALTSFSGMSYATAFGEEESVVGSQKPSLSTIFAEEDLTDDSIDGEYSLESDVYYDYDFSLNNYTFKGTLNGNGYKIIIKSSETALPMFSSIVGGTIKNATFEIEQPSVTPAPDEEGESGEEETASLDLVNSGFYLAKTIENESLIENVAFNNFEVECSSILDNVGLVCGVVSNSVLSAIKITNCSVINNSANQLLSNKNIGFIAGKIHNGSVVKNCVIENNKMNITIGETITPSFNFGGICGEVENSTLLNNIINLRSTGEDNEIVPSINVTSQQGYTFNFGCVAGKSDNLNYLYNNVVLIEDENISYSNTLNANIGLIFGDMAYELYKSNIEGFLYIGNFELFGKRAINNYGNEYLKINQVQFEDLSSEMFKNKDYWNIIYLWDKENVNKSTVWMFKPTSKYPVLQCYEDFSISFSATESKNSIISSAMLPKYDVVSYSFYWDDALTNKIDFSNEKVAYGSTIYLNVSIIPSITTGEGEPITTYYDKFFEISKLQLTNDLGETIDAYSNETQTAHADCKGISIYQHESGEGDDAVEAQVTTNSITYKIENFNSNYVGEYKVALKSKVYKLNVNVCTEEIDGQMSEPGTFSIENAKYTQKTINIKYGDRFILESKRKNTDYSDVAYYYIFNNNQTDGFGEKIEFKLEDEINNDYKNSNFYTNKLEFVFNENCSLFSKSDELTDQQVFDLFSYEEVDGKPNYELKLVFTKRVKQIKIVFKDEDDKEIKLDNAIAEILINDSSENVIWNQEEGVYYAKVNFIKSSSNEPVPTNYTIKIKQFTSMGYEFISWENGLGALEDLDVEKLSGSFSVDETTEDLVIVCKIKQVSTISAVNLMWLWIVLAVAGVALITLLIVLAIRRKSKRNGYKKYFY